MSEAKGQQEPSMEEILASIRRIIAEDGEAPAEAAAPPAPPDDILELTEVVEDEPPPRAAAAQAAPPTPAEPEPAASEPELDSFTAEPSWESEGERLVSHRAAASSAASFAALAGHLRRRAAPEVLLGDGNATLEDIVKDLLRPMLQEWLDAHLPSIVERLVREEIERLGRDAV